MGHFLAATAIRAPVPAVTKAIIAYCAEHSVACKELERTQPHEKTDALLFAEGDWTVVLWPAYFNMHDLSAARHLSAQLGTIVSTVSVHDDDCWCHGLCNRGELLDKFASAPELLELDPAEWTGDADTVAAALGVEPSSVAPYFRHVESNEDWDTKAFPDDEFPLVDFWVFCDFWRCCSISYPGDMTAFVSCLRLAENFADCLPTNE